MIPSRSLPTVPTPSTAAERPYLGGSISIPNDCHLIIVPGTILSQWASEIRIFLNPKAFDLFIYTSGEDFRDDFWSESGPFTRSKQPTANKIILATHSVSRCHFFFRLAAYCSPRRCHKSIQFFLCPRRLRRRAYHGGNRTASHHTTQMYRRPSSGSISCRLRSTRPMSFELRVESSTLRHWLYSKRRSLG